MKVVLSNGSRTWGGSEHIVEVLARGLQRLGHEVVFFGRPNSPLHQRLAPHLACEPVLGGSRFHPYTVLRCLRALRRHRPDVVLGNAGKEPSWSGVAARGLGIPFVYRHEVNVPFEDRPRDRLMYGRIPARVVVNSRAVRRTLLEGVSWLAPERIVVLPNGVDVHAIDAAPALDLELPAGSVAFGFVGRIEEQKGVRELAEAWPWVVSAVPRAHLFVTGFGPMEPQLRSWLDEVPNVHWLGFRRDIASIMKALDVVVVPSHREGFGLVVAEAMAAGAAVIATDTSSLPELVTDGVEGRLVPVRSARALCDAMVDLACDAERRCRMGRAGRVRAERDFPEERMLRRHEALLAEVAAESRAGR